MVIVIESIVLCVIFTLMVYVISREPIKTLYNYPPKIQERVKSLEEYKDKIPTQKNKIVAKSVASILIIIIISLILKYVNGYTTFIEGFGYGFLLWTIVNLYDVLVLDIIWFCHDKYFVFKGTEDMVDEYHNYWFHIKGFIIGEILAIFVCLIVGVVVQLLGINDSQDKSADITSNEIIQNESLETMNYMKEYDISFNQRKDLGIKNVFDTGEYKVKSFGGDIDIVIEKDMVYKLENALSKNIITTDDIIKKAQIDAKNGKVQEKSYDDGGSIEYSYNQYTIIKLNTLEGDKDLIIGYSGSTLSDYKNANSEITLSLKQETLSSKGATFIIKNNSDNTYHYGAAYEIQIKKDNKWSEIKLYVPLTWTEQAYILKPKGVNEINIDFLYGYGELSKGQYRLVKKVNKEEYNPRETSESKLLYAEFEIK